MKAADTSPVDWYVGTYQLRFVELADSRKDSPTKRFMTWDNTVLVKAKSLAIARRKIVAIGKAHTRPYKGGPDGVDVQWVFEGVIELLPVYEEIKDGAEIMWAEKHRTLKSIRARTERTSNSASLTSRSTRSRVKSAPG